VLSSADLLWDRVFLLLLRMWASKELEGDEFQVICEQDGRGRGGVTAKFWNGWNLQVGESGATALARSASCARNPISIDERDELPATSGGWNGQTF
jgi:hypothetical protein